MIRNNNLESRAGMTDQEGRNKERKAGQGERQVIPARSRMTTEAQAMPNAAGI